MDLNLVKMPNGQLAPASGSDEEDLKRIKKFDVVLCKVTKPRNLGFHRKFFAMLQIVFENQERYKRLENLLTEVKFLTGYFEEHITSQGEIRQIPGSISFEKMDHLSFQEFYDKAIDIIIQDIMPGQMDPDVLKQETEKIMGFT